jgi:multiple sugar transport system ATP-binding protein
MLVGLEEVTSGKIYFNGKDVTDLHPSKRNISLAFENYALYPHLSIYENIVYPLRARGYSNEAIKKHARLEELLDLFELRKTDILNAIRKVSAADRPS